MNLIEVMEKMFKVGQRCYFKRIDHDAWLEPEEIQLGKRIFTYSKDGDPEATVPRIYEITTEDILAKDWLLGPVVSLSNNCIYKKDYYDGVDWIGKDK